MSYYDNVHGRDRNQSTLDRIWSKARRRPEALLLFAAGCALMMSKSARSSNTVRDAANSVTSTAREARDYVGDVADQAYSSASSMVEPVRDYANRVTNYVSEAGSNVVSQASDVAEQTRRMASTNLDYYLREQPIALGLLSLAIGAAVGAALPETEVENRTLGAQRELLTQKAREAAGEQIEQLKAAAGQFGEQILHGAKDAAEDGGKSEKSDKGSAESDRTAASQRAGGGRTERSAT